MLGKRLSLVASLGFGALSLVSAPALAQTAPPLVAAAPYAVLGRNATPTSGTVTCTTSTITGGRVGTTGASITNTGPCVISGPIDVSLPVGGSVATDFDNAYSALNSLNPTSGCAPMPTVSGNVSPGVYCSTAATTFAGAVILTLTGNASDVWVFKVGTGGSGALTTGAGFQMVMGPGTQACNVYWRIADAATMTDSTFIGTVLAGSSIAVVRGNYTGRALATRDVTLTDVQPMTFAGCAPPASITVNKDFIPNSVATVPVALTCTSGIVTTTPLNASEAAAAVFTVGGASLAGATCTATETVPAGYTANQANCVNVALNGSCTITNTLISSTITVNKDFIPNSVATVPVALTCTSGIVTTTPLNASEAAAAVFTVTGASPGATCTATETVPAGYTANQAGCVGVALNGSCTITNTLVAAPAGIPTLSEWAMILLAGLLALFGVVAVRMRNT